jgi:CheY-like chemotaxis protein
MISSQSLQIAIVDDSMFMRRMVRTAVAENFPAATVTEYTDGQAAVEGIPENPPDLILLDLLMPKLNGQDTLAQLRAQGVAAPVIVVTADVQQTVQERVRELGAQGFINKPITFEKLKAVLNRIMPAT